MQVTKAEASGSQWQWQGHSIYYTKAGDRHPQRPPLLLIHGFGASTDHWRKNISGLKSDFEVWAIDLLGFGRSAKPDIQYGGDLWRDQLHNFIAKVIRQPAVLVGNSLGGYAALCMAAQCPESAAGLVLVNSAGPFTSTRPVTKPNPFQQYLELTAKGVLLQSWASFLLFQYIRQRSVIRKTLERVYLDHSAITEELIDDIYRPSCDPGAAQVFASVFRTPQGENVDVLLSQLSCPLLMVWGEADPWINAKERGAKFRHYYPELTEHYLKAGHCPHDEVPDQFNTLLREWVLKAVEPEG